MVLTEQIPDLVIIDKSVIPTRVVLVELTVPWDSSNSFRAALERKTARYERLAGDLREGGYNTLNLPLEIGCRGVINARNSLVMETICNIIKIPCRQKLKGALFIVPDTQAWALLISLETSNCLGLWYVLLGSWLC